MSQMLPVGPHSLDVIRGTLSAADGRSVGLSPIETTLLAYLARRRGTIVPKSVLLQDVWGYAQQVQTRTVDATVLRLRAKLAGVADLRVHRGRGVTLVVHELSEPDAPVARSGPTLVGRAAEIATLTEASRTPGPIGLWGPPGVGKSSLAREVFGAAAFLQSMGVPALQQEVARRLGCEVDGIDAALAERPQALVLDDAEAHGAGELAILRAWSARTPVIVIGHQRPDFERELHLQPLSSSDAHRLLERLTGLEDPRLQQLVQHTDRLPQQIVLIARAIAFVGLDGLEPPDAFPLLEEAAAHLIDALEPRLRDVLVAISVFHGEFTVRAVAHLLHRRPYEVLGPLEELWSRSLVQGERGVFRLLAPVRDVAARGRPDDVDRRLRALCLSLVDETVMELDLGWMRHIDDLGASLAEATDAEAAMLGVLLLEAALQRVPAAHHFARLLAPRPRRVGLLLKAMHDASVGDLETARAMLGSSEDPVATDPPEVELLRIGYRILLGAVPDPEAAIAPFEKTTAFAYFQCVICLVAAGRRFGSVDFWERHRALAVALRARGLEVATTTWAYEIARRERDARWVTFGRQASRLSRVVVELRLGDASAAEATAARESHTGEAPGTWVAQGLRALLAWADQRDDEARALLRQHPQRGQGVTMFLDSTGILLGEPIGIQWTMLADLLDAWQAGHPIDPPTPACTDSEYPVRWALARRPNGAVMHPA